VPFTFGRNDETGLRISISPPILMHAPAGQLLLFLLREISGWPASFSLLEDGDAVSRRFSDLQAILPLERTT